MRKIGLALVLLISSTFWLSNTAFAAEPTLQEVYQAAQAGRMREAQAMMDEVLKAHPNSAKAHYVEAELLARQGLTARGNDELATAERLDPGLSFAKPAAVQELRSKLAGVSTGSFVTQRTPAPQGFPWNVLIIAVAVMAAVFFIARRFFRPNPVMAPGTTLMNGPANGGPGYGQPGYGQPGYGQPGYPGAPGGGMGSGILGSLATGAAVGAGIVAGEALMHRVMDGGNHNSGGLISDASAAPPQQDYDMGGSNFGVSDGGSSWDSGSSDVGGGDW
jgi:hypothetical protein